MLCSTETKEVRLRPVTEAHDYEVKVASARKFLSKGSKVKLTMQFSGRELRFKDQGKEMMLVSVNFMQAFICSHSDAWVRCFGVAWLHSNSKARR